MKKKSLKEKMIDNEKKKMINNETKKVLDNKKKNWQKMNRNKLIDKKKNENKIC